MELKKQFSDKALKDFRLIDQAVIEGDEQAFGELLKRYKKPVYHMILKMVRNVDDAEDLTIEAFAKLSKISIGSKKTIHSVHGSLELPLTMPLTLSEKKD